MSVSSGWPAPGKLNLFLHVTARRADGYHELQTVFQLLDLGDDLSFETASDGRIERPQGAPGVPPEEDLVVRAARALRARAGREDLGVRIRVDKVLPAGGGLGGGSSDAATTLVALNRLWGVGVGTDELARIQTSAELAAAAEQESFSTEDVKKAIDRFNSK